MNKAQNYSIDKQRAIEEMLDMNKRANKNNINMQNKCENTANKNLPNHFPAPMANLPLDTDTLTVLALILLLYTNGNDLLLIFALFYIII